MDELALDACVSHLSPNFAEELRAACPDGCDIYYENVGGKVYEAVLPLLNREARITVCGMISQYGDADFEDARKAWGRRGKETFVRQNVGVHDLRVGNYVADYQDQFLAEMGEHVRAGRVQYKEDRTDGLERAPEAFKAMLRGDNFGKAIVVVGDDPTDQA